MSENVIEFSGITKLDKPVERILQRALGADLEGVVVVGFNKDGSEFFASSYADGAQVVWHLQRGIFKVMTTVDRISEEGLPA
jgi:hypothetical protein